MKAHRGRRGTAQVILNLSTRWKCVQLHVPAFFLRKIIISVTIVQEDGWAIQPVLTFRTTESLLASDRIQTPDRQDHSVVTKYNSLSRGLQVYCKFLVIFFVNVNCVLSVQEMNIYWSIWKWVTKENIWALEKRSSRSATPNIGGEKNAHLQASIIFRLREIAVLE